jgi:glycosyltransferase involved in cell wall biosynthesis
MAMADTVALAASRRLVSFVVPAFNEAEFLCRTLPTIRHFLPPPWQAEIIVVDNQSTDDTHKVAVDAGADRVLTCAGTVAALRNHGVAASSGEIIVFLDADVFLTAEWSQAFGDTASDLERSSQQITGSWVSVPERATFIERCWFAPQQHASHSHINSGHMILRRDVFDALGGFDERLRTGEDYELSRRAVANGCAIFDRSALRVIHEGFPKTLWAFARREYWHGLGYYSSWASFTGSRITQIAQLIFIGLVGSAVMASWRQSWQPLAVWTFLAGATFLGLSIRLFRNEGVWRVLTNAGIYFVYMLARFMSFFGAMGLLPARANRSASRTI